MNFNKFTITQAHQGLVDKKFTSEELVRSCLDQIKKLDKKIRAFLLVDEAGALAQAKKTDQKIAKGEKIGLLEGIPCAIKDNIATKGLKTTAASKILENYTAVYDATVIIKLKEAGAVILGKTNLDEFAHGVSTENSAFGPTHNPWDLERVPGGSSGGSTAAVAADMCIFALGTDTGGSIRQPASFCGVVGLKPTYGRCSRYGLFAMTSSTDVPGPITKTVEDTAIVLEVIAGQDKYDATASPKEVFNYQSYLEGEIKGLKIGVPKEYFVEGIEKETEELVREAVSQLEKLGAEIIEISLPYTKYAIPIYYIITPSELSANLSRYDGIRYGHSAANSAGQMANSLIDVYRKSKAEGFGPEAKRRIMLGTYALSAGYYDAYYLQAAKARTLMKEDFDKAFKKVDVIAAPVSPHPAFKIGEKISDPLQLYLEDAFTIPASMAGLPAVSVPCGFSKKLPVGLQLIGRQFDEINVLKTAHLYEKVTSHHEQRPGVVIASD